MTKIAIMQPYFFPYIGYFQLIQSVDKFIFYDDVNFIKNGWINRNRILLNDEPHYITVQLKEASPFEKISNIKFSDNRAKLKKTIEQAYKKALSFNSAWPIVEGCLDLATDNISRLAIYSVKETCKYLNINTVFEVSSENYNDISSLSGAERIIEICRRNSASQYINPIGGTELYDKDDFDKAGIQLNFIKTHDIKYDQNTDSFMPNLSIIDVMMFNAPQDIVTMLQDYELI